MTILATVGERGRSARVVSLAYDLATRYDEPLVVLHVVPNEEFEAHREAIESLPEFREYSLTQEQESAAHFASEMTRETLGEYERASVEAVGRVGSPSDEIVAEAESLAPRFLVVGGRRRTPVGKAIFGSVTQHVLLNAPCPVVTTMRD